VRHEAGLSRLEMVSGEGIVLARIAAEDGG